MTADQRTDGIEAAGGVISRIRRAGRVVVEAGKGPDDLREASCCDIYPGLATQMPAGGPRQLGQPGGIQSRRARLIRAPSRPGGTDASTGGAARGALAARGPEVSRRVRRPGPPWCRAPSPWRRRRCRLPHPPPRRSRGPADRVGAAPFAGRSPPCCSPQAFLPQVRPRDGTSILSCPDVAGVARWPWRHAEAHRRRVPRCTSACLCRRKAGRRCRTRSGRASSPGWSESTADRRLPSPRESPMASRRPRTVWSSASPPMIRRMRCAPWSGRGPYPPMT